MYKGWALKVSAAIFAVVNLLAVPYLFSPYEQELVPVLQVRIAKFVIICLLTAAMVMNYFFYRRLEQKSHSA